MESFSSGIYLVFAVTAGVLFLAGTSLNDLVLATFIKHRCLLTNSNILVFNLCLTNLILSVAITSINIVANTTENWPFGDEGCKAYGFLATLCGLSSINHLAGAAFQQYDTIDRASKGRGLLNKRRVVYVSLLIWLYSVCFSVAPLVGWSSYSFKGIGTSCCVNWSSSSPNNISYVVVLFVGCFVLPLAIICYSYYKVLKVVQGINNYAQTAWGASSGLAVTALKSKIETSKLVLVIIVAFLVSWAPYAAFAIMSAAGHGDMISKVAATVPRYLAKSACIQIPVIYAFRFRKFRKKMLALIPHCNMLLRNNNHVFPDVLPPIRRVFGIAGTAEQL